MWQVSVQSAVNNWLLPQFKPNYNETLPAWSWWNLCWSSNLSHMGSKTMLPVKVWRLEVTVLAEFLWTLSKCLFWQNLVYTQQLYFLAFVYMWIACSKLYAAFPNYLHSYLLSMKFSNFARLNYPRLFYQAIAPFVIFYYSILLKIRQLVKKLTIILFKFCHKIVVYPI